MRENIIDINYDGIQEILRVAQNRWSGIKIEASLVFQYVDDVRKLINMADLAVNDYEGVEIVFHPCKNLYTKTGQYCTCFRAIVEGGEFYLTDIFVDTISLLKHSLSVTLEEPDFFLQEPDLLKDNCGDAIRISSRDVLSFYFGKIGVEFDYKVTEYIDLKKFICTLFQFKEKSELEEIVNNAANYYRRNFPNKIREMKIKKYLGGVA